MQARSPPAVNAALQKLESIISHEIKLALKLPNSSTRNGRQKVEAGIQAL